jgi:hypothetical protein
MHQIALSDLPCTWHEIPAPPELQTLGRSWIVQGKPVALSVPLVVPTEHNYLLTSVHPGFNRVQIHEASCVYAPAAYYPYVGGNVITKPLERQGS